MTTYRFIWKIIDGDIHEQDYKGYEYESDAVDDWLVHTAVGIDMENLEFVDIQELENET